MSAALDDLEDGQTYLDIALIRRDGGTQPTLDVYKRIEAAAQAA